MKKPELLSPAGNFSALKGAINAGADAVYLGGGQYGARAYADNFSREEILEGLRLAHVFGKKIYLTVNTLVKEKELEGLYDFLAPLYDGGLDGVIVQDLGVLRYIRACFPSLAIHASTQMALTGSYGAELIKKEGVTRIVPARELSLEEIKGIKEKTGVEIEAFIHGAMCYCYSGQCLMSSIIGGRSGNRGRCAQPCRLPYRIDGGGQGYPLSMRDMCTLEYLPALIEAKIDSFKIEGRMKKPAYAAGVTAIYRKYIDLYEKDGANYHVEKEDLETLNSLYIRSELSDGYYRRKNGREMISFFSPAYRATSESLLSSIEKRYLDKNPCQKVRAGIFLNPGQEAALTLQKEELSVTVRGDLVQEARKQPLSSEKIKEQIQKSGNSFLKITQVNVTSEGRVFLPVSSLNELRRKAAAAMESAIIRQNGFDGGGERKAQPSMLEKRRERHESESVGGLSDGRKDSYGERRLLHISVRTTEQLQALWETRKEGVFSRIYAEAFLFEKEESRKLLAQLAGNRGEEKEKPVEVYAATPFIVREKDILRLKNLVKTFSERKINGILIRNLESYGFLEGRIPAENLVVDAGLYIWNTEALRFWEERAAEFYLPLEGRESEWRELQKSCQERKINASVVVYGRLPMMITANCLKKTMGKCDGTPGIVTLTDRYEKQFPVYTDCHCCYNIIYNSVPLSLHRMVAGNGQLLKKARDGRERCFPGNFRLDFTVESREESLRVIRYFHDLHKGFREPFYKEYTTGHYKRGVE